MKTWFVPIFMLGAYLFGLVIGGTLLAQGAVCDVTREAAGTGLRYTLSGSACPIAGTLAVYTVQPTNGAGEPLSIPLNDNWTFSAGPRVIGSQAGYWLPTR